MIREFKRYISLSFSLSPNPFLFLFLYNRDNRGGKYFTRVKIRTNLEHETLALH